MKSKKSSIYAVSSDFRKGSNPSSPVIAVLKALADKGFWDFFCYHNHVFSDDDVGQKSDDIST